MAKHSLQMHIGCSYEPPDNTISKPGIENLEEGECSIARYQ